MTVHVQMIGKKRWISTRLLSYLIVGAVGTVCHYVLLVVAVEAFDITPVLATVMGFFLGSFVNYSLNYRFTFESSQSHSVALPRFLSLALLGAGANACIVYAGVHILSVHYLVAQIVATGAVVLATYFANSLWTFR